LVLQSVQRAVNLGLIVPLLVGREEDIRAEAEAIGWDLEDEQIVSTATNRVAAQAAVDLVRDGKADILMKGYLHTDEMLHAVLSHETGLRTDRLLSHVFVLEVPTYHKLLLITDAAININPDITQKASITQNAVDLARKLGVELPKVAALSSVEAPSWMGHWPSTMPSRPKLPRRKALSALSLGMSTSWLCPIWTPATSCPRTWSTWLQPKWQASSWGPRCRWC
jgi:phosphotransacetylase